MADPVVTSHHGIAPPLDPEQSITLTIDGTEVRAHPGEFLIAVAERAGTYIPRFCYHPRMQPVGMCRMCLVEVSSPRGFTLQPACYVPASEGLEVITASDKVRKAQDGVLEFLLINHPLDCPVCDKGGECPLQDQAFSYGPGESRFVEEKRHWAKPTPISDLVLLDRERCIQCGRCVRFAAEIAGEAQIDFVGRGDAIEVAVAEGHRFSSYFSGNTVQICPVGALTASPYRFVARPWDVEQVESTCTICSFGCRIAVQSSAGRITRVLGVDSDPVNQSWLCDKGRFGFWLVGSDDRLTEPLLRRARGEELEPATWSEALDVVATRLEAVREEHGSQAIGVIGGARLANEDAYAWAKLAKAVLGTDSVDSQLDDGLPAEAVVGLPRASIDQACSAKVVVVVSGDLREELPVLYLRLRAAAETGSTRIIELAARPASLGIPVAHRPGESPVVAQALAKGASAPAGVSGDWVAALDALGQAGDGGEGVVVVVGRPSLAEHGALTAQVAAVFAEAWPRARFLLALRRGNVMGALDMGLAPGLLPGRVSRSVGRAWFTEAWGSVPETRGFGTAGILRGLVGGTFQALVLLGADPLRDVPDYEMARGGLESAPFIVSVDAVLSASSRLADVVLPAATSHERAGTITNIEGRVTRLAQKVLAPGEARPDWMIAAAIAERMGADLGFSTLEEIWDEIERLAPAYRGLTGAVLRSSSAADGIVVPISATPVRISSVAKPVPIDPMATPGIDAVEHQGAPLYAGHESPVAEEPEPSSRPERPALLRWPRGGAEGGKPGSAVFGAPPVPPPDAYSLRLVATRRLYDNGVMVGDSVHLRGLVPRAVLRLHRSELERLGVRSGGKVRVRSAAGSLVIEAVADSSVQRGAAWIDFNLGAGSEQAAGEAGAGALIRSEDAVTDIRLETIEGGENS